MLPKEKPQEGQLYWMLPLAVGWMLLGSAWGSSSSSSSSSDLHLLSPTPGAPVPPALPRPDHGPLGPRHHQPPVSIYRSPASLRAGHAGTTYIFGKGGGLITYTWPNNERPSTRTDRLAVGFSTTIKDGILVRIDSAPRLGDYIMLHIEQGKVGVTFNIGTVDISVKETTTAVNDWQIPFGPIHQERGQCHFAGQQKQHSSRIQIGSSNGARSIWRLRYSLHLAQRCAAQLARRCHLMSNYMLGCRLIDCFLTLLMLNLKAAAATRLSGRSINSYRIWACPLSLLFVKLSNFKGNSDIERYQMANKKIPFKYTRPVEDWLQEKGRQLTIFNTQATISIGGNDRKRPYQGQLSGLYYNWPQSAQHGRRGPCQHQGERQRAAGGRCADQQRRPFSNTSRVQANECHCCAKKVITPSSPLTPRGQIQPFVVHIKAITLRQGGSEEGAVQHAACLHVVVCSMMFDECVYLLVCVRVASRCCHDGGTHTPRGKPTTHISYERRQTHTVQRFVSELTSRTSAHALGGIQAHFMLCCLQRWLVITRYTQPTNILNSRLTEQSVALMNMKVPAMQMIKCN
ncbi:Neurexin-3b-beta [Larimichthys crocea]|uniref:Uncharacterized protein n=1 Tax=Larimichthys crocea TaxID=215358 RepID=A0ACD3R0M4_LARCR|nr:Neurexin-3b-beta [Larimichthys crocea]